MLNFQGFYGILMLTIEYWAHVAKKIGGGAMRWGLAWLARFLLFRRLYIYLLTLHREYPEIEDIEEDTTDEH